MKFKASLLAAALLLTCAPLTAHADTSTAETSAEETAAVDSSTAAEDTTAAEESSSMFTEDGLFRYGFNEEGNVEIYDFAMDGYQGEVVIPSEIDGKPVVYVGNGCFINAFNVTSITIPASVEDMGESVFFGCPSLQQFIVEEGNPYYSAAEDGVLMGDDEKFLVCYPAGKTDSTYTIPDTVDEIAPSCFAYTANLTSVTIPDSVIYIDNRAFAYSGIEHIALPDSIVQVDDYCFAYCENLTDVDFGNGIQMIYNAAFAYCSGLTEIELPESLTYVGQYAFAGTGFTTVTIPASVTEISFCAFGYDADLNPLRGFVIKGEPYSAAHTYCTAVDEDNDYKNDFTFVDISNPEAAVSEADDGSTATVESAADTSEPSAEKKESNPIMIVLAVCGGVIAVLAAVLGVLLVKKPKTKDQGDEE